MVILEFIGGLAFLFSLGYLLYFLVKKIRKKESLFSKKLFFSTFLGSFLLLTISMQFDTVSGTEYIKQVEANEDLQLQVEALNVELTILKDEMTQISEENQNFKNEESKITEKFETDKKVLQEEQSALKEQISTLQKEMEDLATKLASAQKVTQSVTSNSSGKSNTQSASAANTTQNVYYKNCTKVREAGAAPIRSGDPGYARHLDRDGDGIGCE